MATKVHAIASEGFGAGTGALYDRARPSYTKEALSALRNKMRGSGPYNVVELGAGTGIFTRALLAHPDWQGAIRQLKAVEPSKAFRDTFSQTVKDERATVSDGTFDTTGVSDQWADAVIVAQAFHWCPDFDAAMKEIARVLKPNGTAFFIWNLEDRDGAQWVRRLRETIEAYENGTPQFRLGLWRQTFGTQSYNASFEDQEELTWSYQLQTNAKGVEDRACSKSYIAVLDDQDKAKVVATVHKILDEEVKVWVDKKSGIFEYPYKTTLVVMQKKSG